MSFDLDKKEFDDAIQNKNYEWIWSAYESLREELIIQRDLIGDTMELEKENEELRELLFRSRSVIDELMGDTDIEDDTSKEFALMQEIAGVLNDT
jgi:hypothetical protein